MRVDSFRGCQLLGREINGLLWNRVERMIFLSAKRRLTVNYSVVKLKKQEKNQRKFYGGGTTIVQQNKSYTGDEHPTLLGYHRPTCENTRQPGPVHWRSC